MSLEIKKIKKSFYRNGKKTTFLDDINIDIKKGEFICLLGPSGCGKSTLLGIISGLIKPDEGNVFLNGKKIEGPGVDRAVMFQEAGLFPWLTVIENVEFGMDISGISKTDKRKNAIKYLKMVHLSEFKDAYIHQLSGGMKQRVALARALTLDSDVLLMDEPFSALDSQTKSILQQEIQKIWWETGKTIIFVTHNVEEAVLLGDRILLMSVNPGRIKEDIEIQIARPRKEVDSNVRYIQTQIINKLKEEVEKVARREFDSEWSIEKDIILHNSNNDMGAGI